MDKHLKARLDKKDGLLGIKVDAVSGASKEDVCKDLNGLYEEIESGSVEPLNFKDGFGGL